MTDLQILLITTIAVVVFTGYIVLCDLVRE
jgi:hypothetical protein